MSAAGNRQAWPGPPPPDQAGLTLIELMAVLVVAGLLSGLAVPIFVKVVDSVRMGSGLRTLAGDLRAARGAALRSGLPVAVQFEPDGRSYRLLGADRAVAMPEPLLVQFLPGPFALASDRLDFLPDGTSTGGALLVQGPRDQVVLAIGPWTGAITIRRNE
jgi:prepilin-type N-terminal cleavage/methylation domain-containing protein